MRNEWIKPEQEIRLKSYFMLFAFVISLLAALNFLVTGQPTAAGSVFMALVTGFSCGVWVMIVYLRKAQDAGELTLTTHTQDAKYDSVSDLDEEIQQALTIGQALLEQFRKTLFHVRGTRGGLPSHSLRWVMSGETADRLGNFIGCPTSVYGIGVEIRGDCKPGEVLLVPAEGSKYKDIEVLKQFVYGGFMAFKPEAADG